MAGLQMQHQHRLLSRVLKEIKRILRVQIQVKDHARQVGLDAYRSFQMSMCRGWAEARIHNSIRTSHWETCSLSSASSSARLRSRSSCSDTIEAQCSFEEQHVRHENEIPRLLSEEILLSEGSNRPLSHPTSNCDNDKCARVSDAEGERPLLEALCHLSSASNQPLIDDELQKASAALPSSNLKPSRNFLLPDCATSFEGTGIPGHSRLGFSDAIAIGNAENSPTTALVTMENEHVLVTAQWACQDVARIAQGIQAACKYCE